MTTDTIKGILIDPFAIEVSPNGALMITMPDLVREVDVPKGIDGIYAALSHELHPVDCFDLARINDQGDGIFIDDNGLWNHADRFFMWDGYPQPLAGRGLILGCDDEGESTAPTVTLEQARQSLLLGWTNVEVNPATRAVRSLGQHFALAHSIAA